MYFLAKTWKTKRLPLSSRIFGLTEKFEQNNRKISLANIFLFLSNFCCWFPVLVFCEIRRQSIETCSKKSRTKKKTRHVRNEFFCIAQLYSKTFSLSLYFISFSCFVVFVYRCTLCAPFCWKWWPEPLKKKNKNQTQKSILRNMSMKSTTTVQIRCFWWVS